ncbi:hypothetical protein Tcan_07270 [Toxocara canis]|uniref:Uncharacterized protein n=1 Tax=Toxocara canis TaxID=6265 RepID=A0A0B2VB26_TOXCA|nr:hypothetical protein Tcan_07270 [Toxocara canis]
MTLKVVVVCALIAVVKCGILDDVKGAASDVGEFFTNKFNDFRSLFPNNESELDKNVQRVKDLLKTISEKAAALRPLANDAQKAALDRVDEMTAEIDDFEEKELDKNVQRVKDLLKTISEKAAALRPLANDAQKAALDRVDEMTAEIDDFEEKVSFAFSEMRK